jgi:carbon storage regulator
MLILTRKLNESIVIGDDIKITVLEIGDGTVRIGLDAPRDVEIFREEVYKEIKEANQLAAQSKDVDVLEKLFGNSEQVGE